MCLVKNKVMKLTDCPKPTIVRAVGLSLVDKPSHPATRAASGGKDFG